MAASQIVPHVIRFPQPSDTAYDKNPAPLSIPTKEPITQLELELFLSLRKRLDELAEQVAVEETMLRTRLECGAVVELGLHTAELKESHRRNVAWKAVAIRLAERLKMDGEAYCNRVLASTKPTRSVSLDVR